MNARPAAPDLRIPVLLLTSPQARSPTDALLMEGLGADAPNQAWFLPPPPPQHVLGCTCCTQRNPAGIAIAALLFAAARGHVPPFTRLLALTSTQAGHAAVEHALANDPVVKARFRRA